MRSKTVADTCEASVSTEDHIHALASSGSTITIEARHQTTGLQKKVLSELSLSVWPFSMNGLRPTLEYIVAIASSIFLSEAVSRLSIKYYRFENNNLPFI